MVWVAVAAEAPGGVEVELTLANDTMKHDRIPASYRRRQLCGWRVEAKAPGDMAALAAGLDLLRLENKTQHINP